MTQFRTLTEIRFKLLTYLPLGTVAAALFVPGTNNPNEPAIAAFARPAIAAFAFVVTLCIAAYNKRNDQHYDELVSRAAELERELQIEHGSFSNRPKDWLKYGFVPVQHRWPIGLIYAAAASLWAYLFTAALVKGQSGLIWLKFTAPAVVIACWQGLRLMEDVRSRKQKKIVEDLMRQLLGSNDVDAIIAEKPILGILAKKIAAEPEWDISEEKAKRRFAYHWKRCKQTRETRSASALLSAVIDLPPRWIEDVWSGRR